MPRANKPISRADLDTVSLFIAELHILAKLKESGISHIEAMKIVYPEFVKEETNE